MAESTAFGEKVPFLTDKEANVSPMKPLPVDFSLFRKHQELYDEFWELRKIVSEKTKLTSEESMENLERRWSIIKEILEKEPNFVDAYWLFAETGVPYGSTFTDEKDLPKARAIFVEVKAACEKCLKIDKGNPHCTFWLGASMGKIATVDGIFASLKQGKKILDLFVEAFNSPYNYRTSSQVSFKGNISIALGVFYRVVPDSVLLSWFFDISGDIDKSIYFHKQAKDYDGIDRLDNTLYLTAALLCKSENAPDSKLTMEAKELIDYMKDQQSYTAYLDAVLAGARHLDKKPGDACGYTLARIQETDESKLKEKLAKENR